MVNVLSDVVAELLKDNRAYNGMTQMQLAEASGVNVKKISQVEIGRRRLTVDEFFAIDKVFNGDLVWGVLERRDR